MASLARALRAEGYSGLLWGMAGDLSEEEGVRKIWDSTELQIMGITGAAKALPRLNKLANRVVYRVMSLKPEAVVLVDSPDFHIPLTRRLRRAGYDGPVIFLSPPTVWAWRKGRVVPLRELFDLCLPLFSFEKKYLCRHGVRALWQGHPMVDEFKGRPIPPRGNRVALMPGSRSLEVRLLTPLLLQVACKLKKAGFEPVFSVAPGLKNEVKELLIKLTDGWLVDKGPGRELIESSAFVVGASGTVAVESMMLDRFMIVLYKANMLEWIVYDNFLSIAHISIPNVLAGKRIYPELLQKRANIDSVMKCIWRYLDDEGYQRWIHENLAYNRGNMGTSHASLFWARSVLELL